MTTDSDARFVGGEINFVPPLFSIRKSMPARRFPPPWSVEDVLGCSLEATAVHQAYRRSRSRMAACGTRSGYQDAAVDRPIEFWF
jgi:hypothetical protein